MPQFSRLALVLCLALPAYAAPAAKATDDKSVFDASLRAWQFQQVRDMADQMDKHCVQHAAPEIAKQASVEKQGMVDAVERKYPGIQSRIKEIRKLTPAPLEELIASQSKNMFKPMLDHLEQTKGNRDTTNKLCQEFAKAWKQDAADAKDLFSLTGEQLTLLHKLDMDNFRKVAPTINLDLKSLNAPADKEAPAKQ